MSNKLLANLDVAVGDNLSAAIELQTRSGTATNLRIQVVFLDAGDAVVAGGTFDGEDVTVIYGNYAASPDITGPWYRSRLFNMVVPAGAIKINVGYAYDSSTIGTITASRKPILNKGAKPAPYSPPADNIPALSVVTLDTADWIPFDDQGIARKALVSAINLTLFNNNLPDTDFDHNQLTNYLAAEHVDWAAASQGAIHSTNLPAIALTDVFQVANEAAQLALTVQEGDVAIRSDESKSYIHNGGVAGTMADWTELVTPTDVYLPLSGGAMSGDITNFSSTGIDDNSVSIALTLDPSQNATFAGEVTADNFQFPATQVASADANNLDDYEEGTWTAELKGSTAAATVPATTTGSYVKIGRQVTVFAYFANKDTTGATGNMIVTGLPFTTSSNTDLRTTGSVMTLGLNVPNLYLSIEGVHSSTEIRFSSTANNASWTTPTITTGTGKYMRLTYTYLV